MIRWQDLVLSCGQIIYLVALLPSLFSLRKPHWTTCFLTGGVGTVFGCTYFTLGLHSTGVFSLTLAGLWLTLGVQSWRSR